MLDSQNITKISCGSPLHPAGRLLGEALMALKFHHDEYSVSESTIVRNIRIAWSFRK